MTPLDTWIDDGGPAIESCGYAPVRRLAELTGADCDRLLDRLRREDVHLLRHERLVWALVEELPDDLRAAGEVALREQEQERFQPQRG